MQENDGDQKRPLGRPKLTESDRIWNEIRDCLTRSAMANMTIPQAKVFSATVAISLGVHFRKLVDMELREQSTSHTQQIALEARLEGRLEMLKAISIVGKNDMMWYGVNCPEVLAVLPECFARSTADIPAGKKEFLAFMEEQTVTNLKQAQEEING